MKHLLTIFIFSALFNSAQAQEVIYFTSDSSKTKPGKKKGSSEMNIIKIEPLGIITGNIPISYERQITDFFSVQLSAGITTRNYLQGLMNNLDFKQSEEVSDIKWNGQPSDYISNVNSIHDFEQRKSGIGYSLSIQPRIYFQSEGISGPYMGISYSMRKYSFSSQKIKGGNSLEFSSDYFAEYDKISEFAISFGTQSLYDRISVEYSSGIALKKYDGIRYAYGYGDSGYIDGVGKFKNNTAGFVFSIRIGYHF